MKKILLIFVMVVVAVYFYLVAAVNDDIKWYKSFSESGKDSIQPLKKDTMQMNPH